MPTNSELLDIQVTSFLDKEVELLKYVNNRMLVDVSRLPDSEQLRQMLQVDTSLTEQKRDRIIQAYRTKIDLLMDFQDGHDIWSYNYKRDFKQKF